MVDEDGFAPNQILRRMSAQHVRRFDGLVVEANLLDRSSLLQQLSLHLPRFPLPDALTEATIMAEAERLSARLSSLQEAHRSSIPAVGGRSAHARDLLFSALSDEEARPILDCFHYLLSFRDQSWHFGLRVSETDRWPIAMCSLSAFDLGNMTGALFDYGYRSEQAIVVSRVYAFPEAPRNSITYLLGRVRHWLREQMPEIALLITYLNPNIGFSGVTYRADNWLSLGLEQGTRYAYYRDNYVTDRFLFTRFGPDFEHGHPDVAFSRAPLEPLQVFCRSVDSPAPPSAHACPVFPRWFPAS